MTYAVRVFIVLSVLFSVGCTVDRRVWGYDRDKLASDLYRGDYSLLKSTDFSKTNPSDILKLGPGAPYYVGLVFEKLNMDKNAAIMLRIAIDRSEEPWRQEAGYSLMRLYLRNQDYETAVDLGKRLSERYPASADFAVLYAQALYHDGKDRKALDQIARIEGKLAKEQFRDPVVHALVEDGHMQLWKAASSVKLGTENWKSNVLSVFEDYPASDVHSRLYIFLNYRKLLNQKFDPKQRLLIEAKYHTAGNDLHTAQVEFADLIHSVMAESGAHGAGPRADLLSPATLEDVGRTYSLLGMLTSGAELLQKVAPALSGVARTVSLDIAGRLYWRAEKYHDAVAVLRRSFAAVTRSDSKWYTPERRDRMLWYLLSSLIDADTAKAPQYLASYVPDMNNYRYFSDIEEELLSRLVDAHAWGTIAEVYAVLKEGGDPGTAASFAVVLAEAIDKGLYVAPRSGIHPPFPKVTEQNAASTSIEGYTVTSSSGDAGNAVSVDIISLLQEAAGQRYDLYFRFLAASALDRLNHARPDEQVMMFSSSADPGSGSEKVQRTGLGSDDLLVRGFFDYDLLADAYNRIQQLWPHLSRFTLLMAARAFADANGGPSDADSFVTESLRTMDLARRRADFTLTPNAAMLMYPLAFPKEMNSVIKKEGLSRSLFYALVREESYFEPGVSSHAGAIGLSQLMPETAADVARRMGIHSPNLSNPATNLKIGAWYLHSLISRFQEPVLALAAYNGGFGRVRDWQRTKDLPSLLLFHESIPIPETRMYIRKILVSSVYYGYLYQHLSLTSVVKSMFPDFMDHTIGKMAQ